MIATAVKVSSAPWERDALIVRVYESEGRAPQAESKLGLDVFETDKVNLIEQPVGAKPELQGNNTSTTVR